MQGRKRECTEDERGAATKEKSVHRKKRAQKRELAQGTKKEQEHPNGERTKIRGICEEWGRGDARGTDGNGMRRRKYVNLTKNCDAVKKEKNVQKRKEAQPERKGWCAERKDHENRNHKLKPQAGLNEEGKRTRKKMGRKKMGGEQARDKEDGSDKQREEERTGEERIRKGMERPAEQGGVERMRSTRGATPRYLRLCCSVGVSFPFSVNFRFLGYFWCSFRFRLSSSFLHFFASLVGCILRLFFLLFHYVRPFFAFASTLPRRGAVSPPSQAGRDGE